jgi:hypothetical protein
MLLTIKEKEFTNSQTLSLLWSFSFKVKAIHYTYKTGFYNNLIILNKFLTLLC